MSGPWEKYAKADTTAQLSGPWAKYANTPKPTSGSFIGDFAGQLGESLQRGLLRVLPEQIGSAVSFAERAIGYVNPFDEIINKTPYLGDAWRYLRKDLGFSGEGINYAFNQIPAPEAQPELQQINGVEDLADPRKLANVIGEQGPAMLANVAATVANPGFGLAFMGAMEGGESLKSLDKIEGLSETNKLMIASGVGAMNAALERLGIDVILGKVPGLKSKIARLVLSPVTEGATEGLQEINQIIGENTGAGDPVFQFTPEDIARLKSSVYGGGVLGLIGGGLGVVGDQQSTNRYREANQRELTIEDVDAAVSRAVVPGDDVADVQAEAARNAAEIEAEAKAEAKAEAEIEQRAADAGIVIPETVQGPQRTQMIEQLLKQREADARNAERENTAKAKLIEEKSAMSRAQAEIEQGKKKKEKGKSDAATVRSWLRQSGLRIKTDDLKRHGFGEGSQENRNLILQVGSPNGITADEAAMQAIESGIIDPPPPEYNPADWLMTQVRDNAPTTFGREQQLQQQADEGFGVISGKQTSPPAPLQKGEKQGAESDSKALKSGKVAAVSDKTDVSAPLNDRIKDKKTLKSAMVQAFGFDEAKADAVSEVYDAVADAWAKQRGVSKDEWYKQRIGDVKRSLRVGDDEVMFQLDQNDFTPERIKSFNIKKGVDATGDVVAGDIVLFKEAVFEGSFKNPKYKGDRWIKAKIVNDSYGKDKQQHTFSLEVIESNGIEPLKAGQKTRRKGRNIYKNGVMRESWQNENERVSVADEKHNRGDVARALRDARKRGDTFYQTAKGAVEFKQTGEAIIHAFRQADVSTALHELAHIFRRDLDAADQQVVLDWFYQGNIPTGSPSKGSGAWTVEVEEAFARAFEKYIYEGKAPNAKLKAVFDKLKQWMRDIYKRLKGSAIDVELSPKMRNLFDRVLDGDVVPKAFLDRAPKSFGEYVQAMGVTVEQLKGDPGMLRYWREQYRERFKSGASTTLSDRSAVSGQRSVVSDEKVKGESKKVKVDDEQVVRDANLKRLGVDKGQFENAVDLQPGQVVTHETYGEVTIVKVDRGLVTVRNAQGNEVSVGRKVFEAKLKGKSEKVKSADVLYQMDGELAPAEETQLAQRKAQLKKGFQFFREVFDDSEIRIKNLQRLPGVKVTPSGDRFKAGVRFPGRVGSRIEDMQTTIEQIDELTLKIAKKYNIDDKKVIRDVNMYLVAKHAPDYNKMHGKTAAGMPTDVAKNVVRNIEGSERGNDVRKLADMYYALNQRTLDILVEGGVILPKFRNFLRKVYPNHVPLHRIMPDKDILMNIEELLTKKPGGKFTTQRNAIEAAEGSQLEVDDILVNIVYNVANAVKVAEKNLVNIHTFNFVRNNPQLSDLFEIIAPEQIGVTDNGIPIFKQLPTGPESSLLPVKIGGRPWYIKIKEPALAAAYKGTNLFDWHNTPGFNFFTWVPVAGRLYSSMLTRFNPEFWPSNFVRDIQEFMPKLAATQGIGFKGAGKAISNSLNLIGKKSSTRAVYDWMQGKDTPGARLYEQMRKDGGTTGGMGLSTRKQIELDIEKVRKINRSPMRKKSQAFVRWIDSVNQVFEDANRLSAYRAALDMGMSRKDAAVVAKESTIDFNKKGTAGPLFNGLYIFSNASVRGSVNLVRAMKNPKVAAAVISSVGAATALINFWNDGIDEDWRDKVTEFDRRSSLVILIGSDKENGIRYWTIPVSWGIKPIKFMADYTYDLVVGKSEDTAVQAGEKLVATFVDAYNPMGGSDLIQSLTPTILDTPIDIFRNRAWHGGFIRLPDDNMFYPELPDSKNYFKSFGDTPSEKFAIYTTDWLAKKTDYAIDVSPTSVVYSLRALGGGGFKAGTRAFETLYSLSKAELPEARSTFMMNRFYKHQTAEKVEQMMPYIKKEKGLFKELLRQETVEKVERRQLALETLERYNAAASPAERQAIQRDLLNRDPRAYDMMRRYYKDELKGLDNHEKQVKYLEPERRAVWIEFELGQLKGAAQYERFDELRRKGVIDGETLKALKARGFEVPKK